MSPWYLPDSISASETPTLAISGEVKMLDATWCSLMGRHGVAQEVGDRDPALHGGHRRERQDTGAVAGGVDVRRSGAGDAVHLDVAALGELHAGFFKTDPGGVGDGADADQAVAAGDLGPVTEGDHYAVVRSFHGFRAGTGQDAHAAALEDFLQHLRGVGVRTGQHPVAAGNQGDLGAQAVVGGGEFGTGHAGSHHDEFLGKLVEVVDLGPVEDAFAVGPGRGQFPRMRTHGQQDGVRFHGFGAVGGQDLDGVAVHEPAGADQDADVLVFQSGGDVPGLLRGPGPAGGR